MTYRAAPITQRDGSPLASSNCRMASIATGIDYHTLGGQTSTGARMRANTDDQEGGTDSGDARQSWARGYSQALRVRDGETFSDALDDLFEGRVVHLDVWHAAAGGPCLSGTGAYGHTMAVAPEHRTTAGGREWLVADPWCKPARWAWWPESKLRAGAQKWGDQVFARATAGRPWPLPEHVLRDLMREAAKVLMQLYRPGQEATRDLPETGGDGRIMFTTTRAQSTGGNDAMGIYYNTTRWLLGKDLPVYLDASTTTRVTTVKAGTTVTALGSKAAIDGDGRDGSWRAILVSTGALVPGTTDAPARAILWARSADMPASQVATVAAWDDSVWSLALHPDGRYPCPPEGDCPECPEVPDVDEAVALAVADRDAEWRAWVLDGSPGGDAP